MRSTSERKVTQVQTTSSNDQWMVDELHIKVEKRETFFNSRAQLYVVLQIVARRIFDTFTWI